MCPMRVVPVQKGENLPTLLTPSLPPTPRSHPPFLRPLLSLHSSLGRGHGRGRGAVAIAATAAAAAAAAAAALFFLHYRFPASFPLSPHRSLAPCFSTLPPISISLLLSMSIHGN